jgi:hypothetical protein
MRTEDSYILLKISVISRPIKNKFYYDFLKSRDSVNTISLFVEGLGSTEDKGLIFMS